MVVMLTHYLLFLIHHLSIVFPLPGKHIWSQEKGHEIRLVTAYPVDVNKLDKRIRLTGIQKKQRYLIYFNMFVISQYLI